MLAMEFVEGLDLSRMVKARGPLPVANACNYIHQAALGLEHAHEQGMVHRDIKPSNLMLARSGNRALIKVLDFGLAKVQSEGGVDGGLTHEGQMLGTPDYISPEQISNAKGADIRADIYSLGCTLYYLLTAGPPFEGSSLYDILQAHHSMDAKPLNMLRPEVPVELAALVAKMMAKEPERRFQKPKEVAQALAPFFKKGESAFKSPVAEVSQSNQAGSREQVPGVVTQPTQPTTKDARPRNAAQTIVESSVPRKDARPVVAAQTIVEPSVPRSEWKTLIEAPETERPQDRWPVDTP
jgi:serine/threonine protein kinase